MLSRSFNQARMSLRHKASRSAAWAGFASDTVRGFLKTAHYTVTILGLVAITALGVMFVKPDFADQLKELSPFATAQEAESESEVAATDTGRLMDIPGAPIGQRNFEMSVAPVALTKLSDTAREQQRVTYWLSKRYRVAGDATNMLVSAAYGTAKDLKLDPLLILSVMAIESGFNPYAESAVGAQGLMQVMSKVHHEKFQELGGVKAALNPVANIKVGSLILKDYVTRNGSVEGGLKQYVGAAAFETDSGYGHRVLAEYHRLKEVAAGRNVPPFSTTVISATPKPQQAERATERKTDPQLEESASVSPQLLSGPKGNQVAAL